eukprot:m.309855 g.309855  ORF g.309855 m.309855 type:complete len:458 (+) comp48296_c0_seq1:88-1461(+)
MGFRDISCDSIKQNKVYIKFQNWPADDAGAVIQYIYQTISDVLKTSAANTFQRLEWIVQAPLVHELKKAFAKNGPREILQKEHEVFANQRDQFGASSEFSQKIELDDEKANLIDLLTNLLSELDPYKTKVLSVMRSSSILGSGACATVYKAEYIKKKTQSRVAVAEKDFILTDDGPSAQLRYKQFQAEVSAYLRLIPHENLLELLGWSRDSGLSLVYELMKGGTLKEALARDNPISWPYRLKVARDVARALCHLHSKCHMIHRDVKSSNILLGKDESQATKLGDLGLAVISEFKMDLEKSFMVPNPCGTLAYMPPEAVKGKVSCKFDVYSFGGVLWEIITGLPAYDKKRQDLISYIMELMEKGRCPSSLIDCRVQWPKHVVDRLIRLASNCSEQESCHRPNMDQVLQELEDLMGEIDQEKSLFYFESLMDGAHQKFRLNSESADKFWPMDRRHHHNI